MQLCAARASGWSLASSWRNRATLAAPAGPCGLHRAWWNRGRLGLKASASEGGAQLPGDEGPQAVALVRKPPGPEVTFVLAGFLKILTIGGLAQSAPVDAVRTAFGQLSPYLMVPVGLVMCLIAKVIVDNNLQESRRFMAGLIAFLVFLYFGLYRLLYRYDPAAELPRRARSATSSSQLARIRAAAGDREIGGPEGMGPMLRGDSRAYVRDPKNPGQIDDLAYYDGRYASDLQYGEANRQGTASTAELDARNPLRQQYKQRYRGGSGEGGY